MFCTDWEFCGYIVAPRCHNAVMSPGKKIQLARKTRRPKPSQYQLADLIGVSRSALAQWEWGKNDPPIGVIRDLAQLWHIPVSWFYDGSDAPPEDPGLESGIAPGFDAGAPRLGSATERVGRRLFPLLGVAGAAAFPLDSDPSQVEDYVEFSDELFSRNDIQFAIRVWGDSMEPRFSHGDYVLVQSDPNFRASGRCVVVADPEGRYLIKVMLMKGNQWQLHPVNTSYAPIRLDDPGWRMIGFAIGWRRDRGRASYIEEGDRSGLRAD